MHDNPAMNMHDNPSTNTRYDENAQLSQHQRLKDSHTAPGGKTRATPVTNTHDNPSTNTRDSRRQDNMQATKKRVSGGSGHPLETIGKPTYLNSTRARPVISAGCSRPMSFSTVGATSASTPFSTLLTRSETTTMGTGLSE